MTEKEQALWAKCYVASLAKHVEHRLAIAGRESMSLRQAECAAEWAAADADRMIEVLRERGGV